MNAKQFRQFLNLLSAPTRMSRKARRSTAARFMFKSLNQKPRRKRD